MAEDLCCCCNSGASDLRSLLQSYEHQGQTEVYANIIHRCFCIRLLTENDDPGKNKYMICGICITRLRDVLQFRVQVETARNSIQKEIEGQIKFEKEPWCSLTGHLNPVKIEVNVDVDPFEHDSLSDHFSTDFDIEKSTCIEKRPNDTKEIKLEYSNGIDFREESSKLNNFKLKENTSQIGDDGLKSRNKKTKCIIAKKRIVDRNKQSKLGVKLNKNDRKCKVCDETFVSYHMLAIHMSIHFPNYICQVCGKFFISNTRLQAHLRIHEKKKLNCEFCDKVFENSNKLGNHRRLHKDKNIYRCPLCPERFPEYWDRVKHLINVHNEEPKKHKCNHCPKRFKLAGQLTKHIRVSHLHVKKFQCEICNRCFGESQTLKNHVNSHNNVKNYQCDICKKSFGKRYTLTEHLKIHNNVKNFVCSVCSRAFTQKCTLKGHMKVHEKEQRKKIKPDYDKVDLE